MKRMVWHYGEGWRPYEEDKKRRLAPKREEDYYRELNRAHNLKSLRDLQDRIALDNQLAEEDKLRLGNAIMGTWKILVNNGHQEKE